MKRLCVTALVLLGLACGKGADFHPLRVGDPAPPYAAVTVDGDSISLNAMRGHAVLINTWATWCPPCAAEMPGFQRLFAMFEDSGLVVIGVNVDQEGAEKTVRDFVAQHALQFTIAADPGQRISRVFATIGVPETFLLDRDGKIIERWTGQMDPMSAAVIAKVREALRRAPLSAS
jgi:peroxiredoxin